MIVTKKNLSLPLVIVACFWIGLGTTSGAPGQTRPAALEQPVEFIHVTDFYHPPADPDDYYDAATVFALHQRGLLSLRGICLDAPREGVPGWGDPATMAIGQLQVLTGASVPFAVGSPHRLQSIGDTQPHATSSDLAAVNLILTVLRNSRSPVVIAINGGSRDVAIALAREPELFRTRCRAIYNLAGLTEGEDSPQENNVVVDPAGAATVFSRAPCPVYWLTGFHAWPGKHQWKGIEEHAGSHDAFYQFQQKQLFEVISPRLANYFAFALRTKLSPSEPVPLTDLNWWRSLNGAPDRKMLARLGEEWRWMWTTAAYLHAAGLAVERDGKLVPRAEAKSPVFDFVPITMAADDQCRISWKLAPENKSRYILTKPNKDYYRQAMPLALVSLLKELR